MILLLEQRARSPERAADGADVGPTAELQNYLIREFVESLYGLQATLGTAVSSPRALEAALLGEFSPAALGERVLAALRAGRRSPTAAAFQFAELLRVVAGLPLEADDDADQAALANVRNRAIDRLMGLVALASGSPPFAATLRNSHFLSYVRASLPRRVASRLLATAGDRRPPTGKSQEEVCCADEP